ncbi:hypothetical protein NDU88_001796 [Pleurodeles waltl]|uniref:Reverse transcriptase domain-containing protein n=1 Tax=Pleurodeles waltl TaxID=8319 RepID=A0AAV7MMI5_PLEWA|nr:hypothetical protein NDU88_001796 [Pleurodeles waltl]
MIFAARQLQEKCQEQNRDLYTTFVDMTKAFDTVSREGLWQIMEKFCCPGKFLSMVCQFNNGMLARVLDDGDFSNAFPVTNGVKQGCVLEPTLFSMMFTAMLSDAFCNDEETSIKIRYRTDGMLLNLRRLQAKTKVKEDSVHDFLFADDCAPQLCHRGPDAAEHEPFFHYLQKFWPHNQYQEDRGLTPQKTYMEPTITAEGEIRKATDKFTYPSSILSRSVNIDDEVDSRIANESSAFGRLQELEWERRGVKLSTKMTMYKAVIMPTLLYACETVCV